MQKWVDVQSLDWLKDKCGPPVEQWSESGTVHAGIYTRRLIDNLLFKTNQTFSFKKGIEVIHDLDVPKVALARNKQTFRTDDQYICKEEYKDGDLVAIMKVSCAGMSTSCKAECDKPLRDVGILNGKCTGCNNVVTPDSAKVCANCGTVSSVQNKWYTVDGVVLCRTCWYYHRNHKVMRCTNEKTVLEHKSSSSHFRCQWKT